MKILLFILPWQFARIPQPINTRTIRLNKAGSHINCPQAVYLWWGLYKPGCNFILTPISHLIQSTFDIAGCTSRDAEAPGLHAVISLMYVCMCSACAMIWHLASRVIRGSFSSRIRSSITAGCFSYHCQSVAARFGWLQDWDMELQRKRTTFSIHNANCRKKSRTTNNI